MALPSPCNTRMRTSGNDEAQVVVRKAAGASDIGKVGLNEDDLRHWHCCGAVLLRNVIAAFLHHHSINALLPPVSAKALAAQPNSLRIINRPTIALSDPLNAKQFLTPWFCFSRCSTLPKLPASSPLPLPELTLAQPSAFSHPCHVCLHVEFPNGLCKYPRMWLYEGTTRYVSHAPHPT